MYRRKALTGSLNSIAPFVFDDVPKSRNVEPNVYQDCQVSRAYARLCQSGYRR